MIFFMINHMLLLSVHCKEAQDSCQYKKLQCDRKENKKYACTVQAPVDGDLCIEVNPPACQKIENVTASKDIKINWTNSTISIEVNLMYILIYITCTAHASIYLPLVYIKSTLKGIHYTYACTRQVIYYHSIICICIDTFKDTLQ